MDEDILMKLLLAAILFGQLKPDDDPFECLDSLFKALIEVEVEKESLN